RSWPTKTITQTAFPENCPPEPRYPCYVVHTTTMSVPIPRATIHLVLPDTRDGYPPKVADVPIIDQPTSTATASGLPAVQESRITQTPTPPQTVDPRETPACALYVTETALAPCPTLTPLPLNSDGCAIVLSTTMIIPTATALPQHVSCNQDKSDSIYRYNVLEEGNHRDQTHDRDHRADSRCDLKTTVSTPKEMAETTKADELIRQPSYSVSFDFKYGTPLSPSPPVDSTMGQDLRSPATSMDPIRSSEAVFSLHTSVEPDVLGPLPAQGPVSKSDPDLSTAIDVLATGGPSAPIDSQSSQVTDPGIEDPSDHETTRPTIEEAHVNLESGSETLADGLEQTVDDPAKSTNNAAQPGMDSVSSTGSTEQSTDDPSQSNDPSPPAENPAPSSDNSEPSTGPVEQILDVTSPKACQACADPCVADLNVVVEAEVPLLVKLFEDKIQKSLSSLQGTLENLSGTAEAADGTLRLGVGPDGLLGLFGSRLGMDIDATALFRRACVEGIEEIQTRHVHALSSRAEKVIRERCESGACLQSDVDKVVRLLDVMLSTDLAKDCSRLRTELVKEFRTRCDQEQRKRIEDSALEKRGLLGDLLGKESIVGHSLDTVAHGSSLSKTVDDVVSPVDKVVGKTVSPLAADLVGRLGAALAGPIKSVVDSFVSNCNQKGLLDFDTEKGVGPLQSVIDVSVKLRAAVCDHQSGA
ncbi:hypothetical protein BGZ72_000183, partial [Mortierella alpina]